MAGRQAGVGINKFDNFSEWYHVILRDADMIDIRYPVKGMIVWRPYGLKALRLTQKIMIDLLERTGHYEAYFPTLIPESIFAREKEFLEGFSGESFAVEGTGTKKFNERFYIRPTSETVMYYMWNMWIKGRRDLPLKMYQVVNVFRYETKMTHPIIRVREIMSFIEAHTAHATKEEVEKQFEEAVGIYKAFFNKLLLPYFIVKTPPWDTFAGAEYNYDFITVMPDGKGLELGSVINLGQRFAKAFDIKFMDTDGNVKYVHQTCYGVSERVLGAVIAVHGDEKGLFFPPEIAPLQVVIVPIAKEEDKDILDYAAKVKVHLESKGIRVHLDLDLERTPGWKYYYWEMKGVPTRIDIGRREAESRTVTIARRDSASKATVKLEEIEGALLEAWASINLHLRNKGVEYLKKMTRMTENCNSSDDFKGLIIAPWDGRRDSAEELEKAFSRSVLGEVVESPVNLPAPSNYTTCSGNRADRFALLGTTY
ncbi:MAG: proline--tRNA ligase [Desulfurococcaceae archaeon]